MMRRCPQHGASLGLGLPPCNVRPITYQLAPLAPNWRGRLLGVSAESLVGGLPTRAERRPDDRPGVPIRPSLPYGFRKGLLGDLHLVHRSSDRTEPSSVSAGVRVGAQVVEPCGVLRLGRHLSHLK